MTSDPSILTPEAAAEYRARVSEISNLKSQIRRPGGHDGFLIDAVCAVTIFGVIGGLLAGLHPFVGLAFFSVSFVLFVVNRFDRRLREIRDRLPPPS